MKKNECKLMENIDEEKNIKKHTWLNAHRANPGSTKTFYTAW